MKKIILTLFISFAFVLIANAQSYLGYVNKTVNFRTEANTNCKVISSLQQGAALFVISKVKVNGYYQVLDIETNIEGFVHSNYVQLDKMIPKNEEGIFTPVGKTSSVNPVIKIHNNTNITLTLKLNDDIYYFAPQERKTLTLTSGQYSYRASAPGVLPDYGVESMIKSYEYEWSFYISTSRD